MADEQETAPEGGIDQAESDASLGAAEWPAGEADEPHGQQDVADSMEGTAATQLAGTVSAEEERTRAERETDGGEQADRSHPVPEARPPADLAEPLR